MAENSIAEVSRWAILYGLPALAGFAGILVGAWLTSRRERTARKHHFLERQVDEFYSPLVGIRREIRAKSELRKRIGDVAGVVWGNLCQDKSPDQERQLSEERFPEFEKIIEYDNYQLAEDLLPTYTRMLDLFRDKNWLAEDSTNAHYVALVEFVEIWNRWMQRSLPREVVRRLNHTEESLKPLYHDLEQQHQALREKIAKGKV